MYSQKQRWTYILLMFCASWWIPVQGHEITANQALQYIRENHSEQEGKFLSAKENTLTVSEISTTGESVLYLVSSNKGGWSILSSDDRATAVLAYAESGVLDTTDIPDGMKWLLGKYEHELNFLRNQDRIVKMDDSWARMLSPSKQKSVLASPTSTGVDSVVLRRIEEISWGQSRNNSGGCSPSYNMLCPTFHQPSCGHNYVGCTIVAMAQIMWYWGWPHAAYVPNSISSDGEPSTDLHRQVYDWANMPARMTYYTPSYQANQIATLLRDCGYWSKPQYKLNGTGVFLEKAAMALKDHFDYSSSIKDKTPGLSQSRWIATLKENINNGRPILYAGSNPTDGIGHAFVIYGYNNVDNKFKINWGWGNTPKTWCALSALTASESEYYTKNQEALLDIVPNYLCNGLTQTSAPNTNTVYTRGGNIQLNANIPGTKNVTYISGSSIRLCSGFHAFPGSNVLFCVKPIPCGNAANVLSSEDDIEVLEDSIQEASYQNDFSSQPHKIIQQSSHHVNKKLVNGILVLTIDDNSFNVLGERLNK